MRKKLLFSILFIGYVVLLGTHSVFQAFDNNYIQNAAFYSSNTHQEINSDQYRPVSNKKNESVRVKINKHFDTAKLIFIVPSTAGCPVFTASENRPLFKDRNYFISAFLFTAKWRGPPATA